MESSNHKNRVYGALTLPAPTHKELETLVGKIHERVHKLSQKLGLDEQDQLAFDENSLGDLVSLSIGQKAGFGDRAGLGLRCYGIKKTEQDPERVDPCSVRIGGFSLNARVGLEGHERKKLEKLIRYMARGPVATERLSESYPDGLIYKLKTPWRDGTTYIRFSPLDFIARLVALIPPPRMNMIRYHGVFAPNFKDRKLIVPNKSQPNSSNQKEQPETKVKRRRERMKWSDMLKRTFEIDVTICPHCGSKLEQIAVIKDRAVAKAILASLSQTTIFTPAAEISERGPPEELRQAEEDIDHRLTW